MNVTQIVGEATRRNKGKQGRSQSEAKRGGVRLSGADSGAAWQSGGGLS